MAWAPIIAAPARRSDPARFSNLDFVRFRTPSEIAFLSAADPISDAETGRSPLEDE
jgi:hypothetical protein